MLCVRARKWGLLQAVSLPFSVRAEGRLPSRFGQHPNQSTRAISCSDIYPGGASTCVCVPDLSLTPPPLPCCLSITHTPLGTTLPIWMNVYHFHIVALMRRGLIIHVRGDKIRGEKINILWACQAHLSKPCVSLRGL